MPLLEVDKESILTMGRKTRRCPAMWVAYFSFLFAFGCSNDVLLVRQVFDGDTVLVASGGHEQKIRLVGIDAPEISRKPGIQSQPFSRKAQKHLETLVRGRSVRVESYGLDVYDRVLGVLFVGDTNANLELVRAGLAEVYRGVPAEGLDLEPFREAEREARRVKRGMWILGDKYVSPRTWRRRQNRTDSAPHHHLRTGLCPVPIPS